MSTVQNQLPVFAQREVKSLRGATAIGFAAILLTFLSWAWLPFLRLMVSEWFVAPEYGVGLTLLAVAGLIVWVRRKHVERSSLRLDGLGCAIIVAAILGRFVGTALRIEFAEGATWVLAVLGVTVLCTGRKNLPWLLPPVLFLGFLLPFPYRITHALAGPLQGAVAGCALYLVQLCGYAAGTSGTLLLVNDATVDVARTCIGLKSLIPFLGAAFGISLLVNRPWWQRVMLTASAVPIGLALISLRVAIIAVMEANQSTSVNLMERYGLWASLLVAVVIYLLELGLLSKLFIEPRSVPVGQGSRLKNALPVVVTNPAVSGEKRVGP